jgi:hypothetical protein
MFTKSERGTFKYWFAHWCAFQMTALNLRRLKPKYLLHDIEKPFLKLFWDYKKVQKWHRTHNSHHTEYKGQWDTYAMVIDWECSRFTKSEAQLNAYDTLKNMVVHESDFEKRMILYREIAPTIFNLGLCSLIELNILFDRVQKE